MIILADDLSGAMDVGMQLKGHKISVMWQNASNGEVSPASDSITVISTHTRNIPESEAHERLANCFSKFGDKIIYKKIDSTMRGNIGAELRAAVECGVYDCVILAPALPANKRTVADGIHYLNNAPLHTSELAQDPFAPVSSSDIAEIIRVGYPNAKAGHLTLDALRTGNGELFIKKLCAECKIIICDSKIEDDLRIIANLIHSSPLRILPCGSAGLMRYIAPPPTGPKMGDLPILVISGSTASASLRQVERFIDSREDVSFFESTANPDEIFNALSESGVANRVVVWEAAGEGKEHLRQKFHNNLDGLRQKSTEIEERTATLVKRVISKIGALVIFGGDTAEAICSHVSDGIEILDEIRPYIPIGKLYGQNADLPIVTKAGGFGDDNALIDIINYLTKS